MSNNISVCLLESVNTDMMDDQNEKTCMYCSSHHLDEMITKPCGCVNKYTHIECLVNHISNTPEFVDFCENCKVSYGAYKCPNDQINFPKLNIYKKPLCEGYEQIDPLDKCTQLKFACVYLIVNRVQELLHNISKEEFEQIINDVSFTNKYSHTFKKIGNFILLESKLFTDFKQDMYPVIFREINMLLFTKQIELMDYICEYDIKISWGKYLWCSKRTNSGFTLTNSMSRDIYGSSYTHMMLLTLNLNEKLLRDCEYYEIYDESKGLFAYNIEPLSFTINICRKIEPKLIGSELKIIFSKKKELTKEEQEIVKKKFLRTPKVQVYSFTIKIPPLVQYGDIDNCNICLEHVDDQTNKYISPCGHLFHLDCIFKYLETKDLLYPLYPECEENCCGARKIKPFECLVCRTLITK